MASKSFRTRNNLTVSPNLQDQVRILASENDRLRAIINQHGLTHLVSTNHRIPDQQNVRKLASPSSSDGTLNPEVITPGTPRRKGCTCKGNCSTRICGCVKKQIPCGEFCRCADELCQNQELDKENTGNKENQTAISQEDQQSLSKLAGLSINDINDSKESRSRRLNKKAEDPKKKRGLFSPLSTTVNPNSNVQERMNESLRFGEDSDRELLNENEDEIFENRGNNVARKVPGRSRRQDLIPVEPEKKTKSALNKEQEDKPAARTKKVRSASMGGREEETSSKEAHSKTLAGLINGKKPLRRAVAAKMGEASSSNYGNIENQQSNDKLIEEQNKKMKKAEKGKTKKKGTKNQMPIDEEQAEVNQLLEEAANNIQLAVQEEMQIEHQNDKIPSDSVVQSEAESKEHSDENTKSNHPVKTEPEESESLLTNNPYGDQSGTDSSSSSPNSASYDHLLPIDDPNFNPMKPRHNLSRSPVGARSQPWTYQTLDVSEIPLVPPLEEVAEEIPPPDELNCVTIDWDKHQQERVYCTKCHRGFYPYRIKKHEASCKKV